jgi:hypothetical protein
MKGCIRSSGRISGGTKLLTSLKRHKVTRNETITKLEVARHGRKYGYFCQKGVLKYFGNLSCGRDKDPPMKGLKRRLAGDETELGIARTLA